MRTNALDRFGTRLEQRFTRGGIEAMMKDAGLRDIRFRQAAPLWCAVGTQGEICGGRPMKELHCINISEAEIAKGIEQAVETENKPRSYLMDANNLQFSADYLNRVFGSSVLHHSDSSADHSLGP